MEPTKIVMFRGLSLSTTRDMIADFVKVFGRVEAVRLIKDKISGESRGFAFVEFPAIQDAVAFVDQHKDGWLQLNDRWVEIRYATESKNQPHRDHSRHASNDRSKPMDWICPACSCRNFARRVECFSCKTRRPETAQQVPRGMQVSGPTRVILTRGLPLHITEYELSQLFAPHAQIKEIRLIRDKVTNAPRGFAFTEFNTVEEAVYAMQMLGTQTTFCGSTIRLSYAERNPHSDGAPDHHNRDPEPIDNEEYIQYYTSGAHHVVTGGNEAKEEPLKESMDTSLANFYDVIGEKSASGEAEIAPQGPTPRPDSTPKQIQDSTDWKYDNNTQMYFNATTQIYYQPHSAQYYKWDYTTQQYVLQPAPNTVEPVQAPTKPEVESEEVKPTEVKKPAVVSKKKQSKAVSQNLAKWSQKSKEISDVDAIGPELPSEDVGVVSSGFIPNPAARKQKKKARQRKPKRAPKEPEIELPQITHGKICLLCRKQFGSEKKLQKHVNESPLHERNLEALRKQLLEQKKSQEQAQPEPAQTPAPQPTAVATTDTPAANFDDDAPLGLGMKRKSPWEQNPEAAKRQQAASPEPEPASGVGAQMMKMMGWRGGGLGKNEQGRTEPIQVQIMAEGQGLGNAACNPMFQVTPEDDYASATRKRFLQRFDSLK